jgi:ribosomal protein S8
MEGSIPRLIEPGVKSFLAYSLKGCRAYKDRYITITYNIVTFLVFIGFIGGILWYKYKGNISNYEKELKERKKQEYIISKLQQVSYLKNKQNHNIITDLPNWNNHPEAPILNRKIYH